ncbi:uncharacterized protein LOC117610150 [Osmia lignaria lignaria]|uniref:uncharacterized protein LOC117610150 n=1 Tax=Osmia lignaria lignaria TaxID=1437193 RepID=UPI00402BA801
MLHYFAYNIKKHRYLKSRELIPGGHGKELSNLRSYQCPSCDEIFQNHRRKLLSYTDEINSHLDNTGLNDFLKVTNKDTENHGELWDNWSNWSKCSVTCGNGRQVRWRHCLAGDCTKGLKKAQMKTCRQKQCGSKTFLHWLGIKS